MLRLSSSLCSRMLGSRAVHTLPELQYEYTALEPVISGDIMKIHHQKHHATYVANLNKIEQQISKSLDDPSKLISLQSGLKFNGGGHVNHSIFWTNLSPQGGGAPTGDLAESISYIFDSFDNFKARFSAAAVGVQGSGWAWLCYNPATRRLRMTTCANQDPPEGTQAMVPLLGIDVWEHAYYLQYKNARLDYVNAIWDVINWENVAERYADARMKY